MRNNKFIVLFAVVACSFVFLFPHDRSVSAEEDGGDILFKDTKKQAPVLFSHKKHKEAGNKCEDCHDKIFQKKKGSADQNGDMNMASMKEGKYCGSCHNGEKVFYVGKNCGKCHIRVKTS